MAVIAYLRSLRDNGIPAWRRLQAARALESYQAVGLGTEGVDFDPITSKLHEISRREKSGPISSADDENLVAGEGNVGRVDDEQAAVIRRMRGRLRVLHHKRSTENAYIGWIRRLIYHVDDENLEAYGPVEVADFLTELALTGEVSAGTQNQALAACLFLYEKVFGRDVGFINAMRAKPSNRLPVVLTRSEVAELMSWVSVHSPLDRLAGVACG